MKKKYLIGIQPTGKLHIGNYLGCISKGLKLQNEGNEVIFLIANYHSLTTNSYSDIAENELKRLGCKNIIKQTPEYTELFFKLCCKLNLGTLLKMPQYKDKKENSEYDLGLLLYPVLMTADIIINNPDVVIIGKDQVQHIELCNDISKRIGINKKYEYEFGYVDKIMSLINPEIKMSKSSGEKHVLYLFDENYKEKIKLANTNELGIDNLKKLGNYFNIEYKGINSDFKNKLSEEIEKYFSKFFL